MIEDGDDEDDGEEISLKIYFQNRDPNKILYCKIKYEDEEYEVEKFTINKQGDLYLFYNSIFNKYSKGIKLEFNGTHLDNEIKGKAVIEKNKKYPIINQYYISTLRGSFKVTK